jgi:hypothetical protein
MEEVAVAGIGGEARCCWEDHEKESIEYVATNLLIIPSPLRSQRVLERSTSPPVPELRQEAAPTMLDVFNHHATPANTDGRMFLRNYKSLDAECKRLRESHAAICANFASAQRLLRRCVGITKDLQSNIDIEKEANVQLRRDNAIIRRSSSTHQQHEQQEQQDQDHDPKDSSHNDDIGTITLLNGQLAEEKRNIESWKDTCAHQERHCETMMKHTADMKLKAKNDIAVLQSQLSAERSANVKSKDNLERFKIACRSFYQEFHTATGIDDVVASMIHDSEPQDEYTFGTATEYKSIFSSANSEALESASIRCDLSQPTNKKEPTIFVNDDEPQITAGAEILMQLSAATCNSNQWNDPESHDTDSHDIIAKLEADNAELKTRLVQLESTSKPASKKRKKYKPRVGGELVGNAAKWLKKFEQLKKYQAIYGDCHVSKGYADNKLYEWAYGQRQQLKHYPTEGYRRGRIDSLNSIGYYWGKRNPLHALFHSDEDEPPKVLPYGVSRSPLKAEPIDDLSTEIPQDESRVPDHDALATESDDGDTQKLITLALRLVVVPRKRSRCDRNDLTARN